MGLSIGVLEEMLVGRVCVPPREAFAHAGWSPESQGAGGLGWSSCPRCGSSMGAFEADIDGCSRCRSKRLRWDRSVRLGVYDGVLREQLLRMKYQRWRPAGVVFGEMLGAALAVRFTSEGLDPTQAVLVPVPTTWRRRTARGFDHAGLLVDVAAGVLGCRVMRVLGRRHRPAQASLPASRRRSNVSKTMRLRGHDVLEQVHARGGAIVVVDDIRTTGATLTEAWRALAVESRLPKQSRSEREGLWAEHTGARRWVATVAVAGEEGL